jgi:hypothetical protein
MVAPWLDARMEFHHSGFPNPRRELGAYLIMVNEVQEISIET